MISWNCHGLAAEICHRHSPRWKIYSLVLGRKYVCQGLVIWELLYMHTYYRLCFKWKRLTQKQCDPRSTIEKTASENFPHSKMEKVSFLGAKFIFGASMDVLFCGTTCNMYLQNSLPICTQNCICGHVPVSPTRRNYLLFLSFFLGRSQTIRHFCDYIIRSCKNVILKC